VSEIAPGLWTWTGPHPEWEMRDVRSYKVGAVLIDPIAPLPPGDVDGVLLTVPWHRRSTGDLPVLDEPPPGIESYPAFFPLERAYVLVEHRALVLGDCFMDGAAPPAEWEEGEPERREHLRALLDLAFDRVLPTHGDPADRAAFERALD